MGDQSQHGSWETHVILLSIQWKDHTIRIFSHPLCDLLRLSKDLEIPFTL